MAQVSVTVRGVSRGVLPGSLNISQTLFQRSTCEFSIPDPAGTIVLSVGENVLAKEEEYVWFAGTITDVERVKSVHGSPRYLRVKAVDYSQMCDRRITNGRTWANAKLTTIVRDIAVESLDNEGLDLSLVLPNQGPDIAEFKVDFEPVSDAFNRLCSQVGAYWRINKGKQLIAKEFTAGFQAGAISDVSGNIVAGSLQSRETREQFANHIVIRFNNYVGAYTKTFTGDGALKQLDLDYEVVGQPTITVGSPEDPENYTYIYVGNAGTEDPNEYPDDTYAAFWTPGSKTLIFNKPIALDLPVEISYKGKSIDYRDYISADSINTRKAVEGGSGVYTKVLNIDAEITPQAAEEIAQSAVDRLTQLSTTVTFESDQIIAAPGDKITSSFSGIPTGTYVVRSVRTSLIGKDVVRSAIEMASGNLILDGMESIGALGGYVPGVASLPITSDVEPAFPNVTGFAVTPSQVEIDGVLKYSLEGSYTVPASSEDARFGGVHLYLRDAGRLVDLGYQPTSVAAGQTATFTLILRLPPADTEWTLYAVSRDKRRSNVFDPTASPQATIQAKAQPLDTIPDVTGFKAGTDVAGTWTNSWYWDDLGASIGLDLECHAPADTLNWSGVSFWLKDGTKDAVQWFGREEPDGNGLVSRIGQLSSEFIPTSGAWTVIAVSHDRNGKHEVDAQGKPTGPSVTVPVGQRPTLPGGTIEDPAAPTNAVITVVDKGSLYSLQLGWTPPNPVLGTVGYEREARFFKDAACTVPDSDWIVLGSVIGATTATSDTAAWPRPTYDAWVKGRVRAFNSVNATTAWVTTAAASKLNKTTETGTVVPAQVTSGGWSVAVAEYGTDPQTGKRLARLRFTITDKPSGTDYFTVWTYKGASPPANPSDFNDTANKSLEASGDTYVDCWIDREAASVTYQCAVTASSHTFTTLPDGSTPVKAVVVTAAAPANQVTGFSVTAETGLNGGVPSGRYRYQFTKPTDLDYFYTRISRIRTDASFTPLSGATWGIVAEDVEPSIQAEWWVLPGAPEYWRFRAETVTRAELVNAAAVYCNVTVPASTGIIANLGQATGILPMEALLIQGSDNAISNPGFEANGGSGIGWHQWGDATNPWTFPIGNYRTGRCCAAHIGGTGSQALANSAGYKVAMGDQLTLSVYLVGEAGYNGTATIYLFCVDNSGGYVTSIAVASVAGGASDWVRLSASATVPLGVAVVVPVLQLDGHTTAARWFADDFSLVRQIGGSQIRDDALGRGVVKTGDKISASTDNTANLLSNPGFEFDRKDWSAWQSDLAVISSPTSYSGSKCLQVDVGQSGVWTKTPIVVKAGEKYKAETWVLGSGGLTGQTAIALRIVSQYDEAIGPHVGSGVTADEWTYITPTTTWTQHTVSITATQSGYLWLFLWGGPTSGTFWFDSAGLYKVIDSSLISDVDSGKLTNLSPELSNSGGQLKIVQVDFTKALNAGAEFGVTVQNGALKFTLNSVDFSKATAYDSSMFEVSGGTFKYKELKVEKLKGTVASFGGPGQAGLVAIFNYSGELIGWDGDDRYARSGYAGTGSGYEGGWRKRFLIGGTSPATAKIVFDSNGNGFVAGSLITGTIGANVAYLGTVYLSQLGSGTLPAGVVYAGTVYLNQLGSGTLPAGVVYAGTVNADKLNAGTVNVGSGGMTFSGTGGVTVAGAGSVNVLVGNISASGASFMGAGYGWTITGGIAGYISGNGYINANGGYRVNGVAGLTGTYAITTPTGAKTLYINGGIITGLA